MLHQDRLGNRHSVLRAERQRERFAMGELALQQRKPRNWCIKRVSDRPLADQDKIRGHGESPNPIAWGARSSRAAFIR
jgi:hypothetical protein